MAEKSSGFSRRGMSFDSQQAFFSKLQPRNQFASPFLLRYRPAWIIDQIITIEAGKRRGKPSIPGLRITVSDVLDYLASGMSHEQILHDFPYLTEKDIGACLAFAADRERKLA